MRSPVSRTLALSLIIMSAVAQAKTAVQGEARCHLKMDDQSRYDISFGRNGGTVDTPLGKISYAENQSHVQLDSDVLEINSTGKHADWTGNVNINRADGSLKDQKNTFVLLLVSELYLKKGEAKGVLTCGYFEDDKRLEDSAKIEKATEMSRSFEEARRAALRIQGYYLNPKLAESPGLDTANMIIFREQNFLSFIADDIEKININDENNSLIDVMTRQFEKTQAFSKKEDAEHLVGDGIYRTAKPEIEALRTEKGVDIVQRYTGISYEPAPYRQYGVSIVTETFAEKDIQMLMPGYPVLVKNSTDIKRLQITQEKNGRISFKSTKASQAQGRVLFYSATQFVPFTNGQNKFEYDLLNPLSEVNEIPSRLEKMGKPLAEIALKDTKVAERSEKLTDRQKLSLMFEYMNQTLSNERPNAEVIKEALKASGLEKNPNSSTAGLIRIMMSETLRALAGLPSSQDPRVNQAIDSHLQKLIAKQSGQKKIIAKIMFIERAAVIAEFQRLLAKNLNIQKTDNIEAVMKKVASGLSSERNSKRTIEQLEAWLSKQKATFTGLCSWAGVGEQGTDGIKQGFRLLMTWGLAQQSEKDIKGQALVELNEQLARALIVLTNKG